MRYSDQVIRDCNLLGNNGTKSVFGLFNRTRTSGGAGALEKILTTQKQSLPDVLHMHDAIRYVIGHLQEFDFRLNNSDLVYIQQYFRLNLVPESRSFATNIILRKLVGQDPTYAYIRSSVIQLTYFLKSINNQLPRIDNVQPDLIRNELELINRILSLDQINQLLSADLNGASRSWIMKADGFIRNRFYPDFVILLDAVYEIEAYHSIATAAVKHNLVFPVFSNDGLMKLEGIRHLLLRTPVENDLEFQTGKNLVFLSGPNMSGKSTFLRAVSTTVVLAHAGLPVPVTSAVMPFFKHINIHISGGDDLFRGYSHFYNELMLVTDLVKAVRQRELVFGVFDEIFSGTNVTDAIACAALVIEEVSKAGTCRILLSSHNLQLAGDHDQQNIQFNYIEALSGNDVPVFTYKLREGKSSVGLGEKLFRSALAQPGRGEATHKPLNNLPGDGAE